MKAAQQKDPSRRTLLASFAALLPVAPSAQTTPLFRQTDPNADPAPLLDFVAANDGGFADLDVRLLLAPTRVGIRGVVLRNGAAFAFLDLRGWRGRGIMIPLGGSIQQADQAVLKGRFQIAGEQSFKGPTFSSVDGLPWLFTGYYLASFA